MTKAQELYRSTLNLIKPLDHTTKPINNNVCLTGIARLDAWNVFDTQLILKCCLYGKNVWVFGFGKQVACEEVCS